MIAGPDRVAAALALARALFPAGVAVAATDPRRDHPMPLAGEGAARARMAPARAREFAAGRAAARRAMVALGEPPRPVPMGADRAPLWPAGLTGSISHARTACVAALARTGRIRALGVDVEEAAPLEAELHAIVLTAAERERLARLSPAERGHRAKLIFSAKECAYKCQYSLSGAVLDFHALEVAPDPGAAGRFAATFRRDVPPFGRGAVLEGRFAVGAGLILTAMTLPREGAHRTGQEGRACPNRR